MNFRMSEAIREAYKRGEDDEIIEPLVIACVDGRPYGRIGYGDYVIFYDIRGEREIQLTEAFTNQDFSHFQIDRTMRTHWATMIEYHKKLGARVAFLPLEDIEDTLSEVISRNGLKQVKIAESEKSIHLSYFFNGKHRTAFAGEERVEIPSRKDVRNYDECPEMSAADVGNALIEHLRNEQFDFIVGNFANIDVLGHIENREAILTAVTTVDAQVGRVVRAAQESGVTTIITSDHGTVEKWLYPEGAIDTGHTDSPVHCIVVPPEQQHSFELRAYGTLCDIAPTVLHLLNLEKPAVMTGKSLVEGTFSLSGRPRVLLLITDGWGHNDDEFGNLILESETPEVEKLKNLYPHTTLQAAGEAVGLPAGTVGNSEAGHLHLGAGRVIPSDRVRIDTAIQDGSFFENDAFVWAMRGAREDNANLHLLGIISFFSSHGSVEHLLQLLYLSF